MNFKNNITKNLISNPQKVFLIDGFGAILSAISLGVLLVQFESAFGMPKEKLFYLAAVAVIFAIYSISCYLFFPKNWRFFLAVIAISNLVYCLVTLRLIVLLYQNLTILGWTYFVLELIILILIISIEIKTIRKV